MLIKCCTVIEIKLISTMKYASHSDFNVLPYSLVMKRDRNNTALLVAEIPNKP